MASLSTISRLSAIMTLDVTRFMTNSERVSAQLKKLRGEAVAFGQGFSRTFSLAFGLVAAAAIKTAAGFDQLQAQLQAVTSGQGLSLLESEAKRLGRTTVFTATQVANLQLELAKLGFGTQEVVGGVEAATRITAVFGGDLVKTGTTIAESVRQFSNENLNAKRVADVMAVAFKETALSTENFGQAMKNVGSVANITGNDFETTVALLGLLANAGQKGGIAGTRLKGVMIRLGKQFGVSGKELQLLTSGQLDFNQLIEIFRNRAGVAAAVISEMGDEFQILKQKLLDSRGSAAALESALNDRLFFSLKRIEAATESAGITIGEAFGPTLLSVADSFQSFAEFLEDADKGTIKMVVSIGTFLAVLPIVVFLVTQVGTALAATFLSAPGLILATIAAIVSLGIASKVELGKTLGVLERAQEGFLEITGNLKKFAEEGAEEVTRSIKVLNEELDKVAADDRLGAEEKIEATNRLQAAIRAAKKELDGFNQFTANNADVELKDFSNEIKKSRSVLKDYKRELAAAEFEAKRLAESINNLPIATAGDFGNVRGRREGLLGELEGVVAVKAQLQIDINREKAKLEDLLNQEALQADVSISLDQAFKDFVKVSADNFKRVQDNLKEIDRLQEKIAARTEELRELGLENNLAVAQEQIGNEKQREVALILDNAAARAEVDKYLDVVKQKIDDLDLSIFSAEQLAAQETELNKSLKRIDEALAVAQGQLTTPFQNFLTDIGTFFRESDAMLLAELDALAAGGGFFGSDGAFAADARVAEEFVKQYRTAENIQREIKELTAQRVIDAELLAKFEAESLKRQEEQLKRAQELSILSEEYGSIFEDQASAQESVSDFEKLVDTVKDVVAGFGVASGNIKNVTGDIERLNSESLKLANILIQQDTRLEDLLKGSLDAGKGSLNDRKSAIDGIVKALDDFIAKQTAAGKVDLAVLFEKTRDNYARLQRTLERRIKFKGLIDASRDAEGLNNFLFSKDLIQRTGFLRGEISRLSTLISAQQKAGFLVDQNDVDLLKLYKAELEDITKTVQETNFKLDLGTDDPRLITDLDKINKKISLFGSDSAAEVEELTKRFNELPDKLALVDSSFDLGDGSALIGLQSIGFAIKDLEDRLSGLTEGDAGFAELTSTLAAYTRFRDDLIATNETIQDNVDAVTSLTLAAQRLESEAEFKNLQAELQALDKEALFGIITNVDALNARLPILQELFFKALADPELAATLGISADNIEKMIKATEGLVEEYDKYAALQQFVQQQINFVGDAFVQAAKDGKDFFQVLKDGFLNTFYALIGKLITLIALFIVLNILTGGAFMKGGAADTSFTQFLGQGFGFNTGGGGSGFTNPFAKSGSETVTLGGRISGNNIVLANERGTRAMDRTFG